MHLLEKPASLQLQPAIAPSVNSASDGIDKEISYLAPILHKSRILLIDDDASFLDYARDLLLNLDYLVLCFDSPKRALAYLSSFQKQDAVKIDVIICDLIMPEMTGLELHSKLRKEYNILTRFIMISGETSAAESLTDVHGVDAFLAKPLHIDALLTSLKHNPELDLEPKRNNLTKIGLLSY